MRRPQPMQEIYLDDAGTARFRENKIVSYLLNICGQKGIADMNMLAVIPFNAEDREQFAQLIGYSVSGYGELSYVSSDSCSEADMKAEFLQEQKPKPKKKKGPK